MLHGIEPFEFDARIRRAKLPVDRADLLVAMVLPKLYLLTKVLNGGNVVGQALPCQHAEFNLRDIEPTGMLRGVVDLQAIGQGFSLFRREHFVERGGRVGIEVIHRHDHF